MMPGLLQPIDHAIFMESHEAIFVAQPDDLRIRAVNPAAEQLTQRHRDHLLERTLLELLAPRGQHDGSELLRTGSSSTARVVDDGFILMRSTDSIPVEVTLRFLPATPEPLVLVFVRDQSPRQRLEAELCEQEGHFRRLTDLAPDPTAILQDGRLTYVNRAMVQILGAESAEQLLGKPVTDFLHPEDWAASEERQAQIMKTGQPVVPRLYRVRRLDGQYIDLESCSGACTLAGRPAVLLIARDVQERQRGQRRENQRRSILEQMAKGMPLPVVLHSIVLLVEQESPGTLGSILLLDRARQHLLHGAAPHLPEFYNQAIHGVAIGPDVGSCGTAAFTGKRIIVEDVDTHPAWTHYRDLARQAGLRSCWSEPVLSSTGQVLGTFALYYTRPRAPTADELECIALAAHLASIAIERQQADEALRESEDRYRGVLESLPVGVFVHDGKQMFYANSRAVQIVGAGSATDFARLAPFDIVAPEYRAMARWRVETMLRTGEVLPPVEARVLCLDGSLRDVEVTSRPTRFAGHNAVQVLFQDVTERKRAEEERRQLEMQMQQAQKLESLGVLAGGVAHDFNNLLTAILGHAELAMMELPPTSTVRSHLTQVMGGARRAAELANQMLTYAGKSRSIRYPLVLSDMVHDLAELLKASISKKAQLHCHLASNLPLIEADPTQLRQVIMNLILNASDALGEGEGVITVRTETRPWPDPTGAAAYRSQELPPGTYGVLEVADTGCGMSADVLGRIFDPFFTTKFTGRGLGLAAVLGIVHSHGGAIQVMSSPGIGTTFQVYLPPAAGAVDRPVPSAPGATWQGKGTILIVDDEEAVRALAQQALHRLGFSVLTARDGREGVEIYRAHAEHLVAVLLDLTMPGLDGVETFHKLQQIRSDVRVVFSSGYGEHEARQRLGNTEVAGFVTKPYRLDELKRILHQALDNRKEANGASSPASLP